MARMLVTRPDPDAAETAARLDSLGIEAVQCPLLIRQTLDTSLPAPEGFAAMALTSANALRALADRGDLERYRNLKIFAVGDTSAHAAAREHGFVDVVSAGGRLGDLVELLAHSGLAGPVFHPGGKHQAGDLAKSLAAHGVMVVTARVYEMVSISALPDDILTGLQQHRFDAVLFYSRRTAETFVSLIGDSLDATARRRLSSLCLSEAVAEPLIAAHFVRMSLADYPSEDAMMALALAFAREQNPS